MTSSGMGGSGCEGGGDGGGGGGGGGVVRGTAARSEEAVLATCEAMSSSALLLPDAAAAALATADEATASASAASNLSRSDVVAALPTSRSASAACAESVASRQRLNRDAQQVVCFFTKSRCGEHQRRCFSPHRSSHVLEAHNFRLEGRKLRLQLSKAPCFVLPSVLASSRLHGKGRHVPIRERGWEGKSRVSS